MLNSKYIVLYLVNKSRKKKRLMKKDFGFRCADGGLASFLMHHWVTSGANAMLNGK